MKKRRTRKRSRRTQKKKIVETLNDPREPIRRGVPNEPRLRRDRFAFLCLTDMTVFQSSPTINQARLVECPKCQSAEDVVIYR